MALVLSVAVSQLIGCASGPDPADLVKAIQTADTIEIKIQITDGTRTLVTLTDTGAMHDLSKLLKFKGDAQHRPEGTPGTLENAYFTVVRKGATDVNFTLVGTRAVFFGPGGQYQVRLDSREFHDKVHALSKAVNEREGNGKSADPKVSEIKAQWKAAKRLQIENSRANGAREYEINDTKTIEHLVTLIDEKAEVKPQVGNLASANYVVIKILAKGDSKAPVRELTVTGKRWMFQEGKKLFFFELPSDELYRRLRDQDVKEKENASKPGEENGTGLIIDGGRRCR